MPNQTGRQLLLIVLISIELVQACVSTSAPRTINPVPTSAPTQPPDQTQEQKYALYAGFTNSKEIPFVILHMSGEKLGLTRGTSSSKVTGVVWISPKGETIVIYADENGMPGIVLLGEDIIAYSNYTATTVDLTIIRQNGHHDKYKAKLDTAFLNKIKALSMSHDFKVAFSQSFSQRNQQDTFAILVKEGLYFFGTAACLVAITASDGIAIEIPGLAEACAGSILATGSKLGNAFGIDVGNLEFIGGQLDIVGCFGRMSAPDCANLAASETEKQKKVADQKVKDALPSPNLGLVPTPVPPTSRPTALPTSTPPFEPPIVPTPARPTDTGSVLGAVSSLRGTVTQKSSCRYGPSQYHLYKTGFKPQAPVKIIGRDADGDWVQIELSGRNTPCWMNASLVQLEGDVMALPDAYPPDRRLPISDAFPQIALISASPGANGVTASWVYFEIREDLKQTDTVEYVIEVWTCVDGKPAFYAVGTNDTFASFQVDNSCGIASHADLIGQDEHGFSFPTNIPLP